jgi:hypothetical protein
MSGNNTVPVDGSRASIVMATHGRTGLQCILLGSITQKVLAASRVPVMVLPLALHRAIRQR